VKKKLQPKKVQPLCGPKSLPPGTKTRESGTLQVRRGGESTARKANWGGGRVIQKGSGHGEKETSGQPAVTELRHKTRLTSLESFQRGLGVLNGLNHKRLKARIRHKGNKTKKPHGNIPLRRPEGKVKGGRFAKRKRNFAVREKRGGRVSGNQRGGAMGVAAADRPERVAELHKFNGVLIWEWTRC